jgi:hypothetical protein
MGCTIGQTKKETTEVRETDGKRRTYIYADHEGRAAPSLVVVGKHECNGAMRIFSFLLFCLYST